MRFTIGAALRTDQPLSHHIHLGHFLRARREQTRPEDIGLPASTRRRTPGLRREEVAVLANVGVSWYTWLEQGRAIGASGEILEAISEALRLGPEDRTHIRRLASGRRTSETTTQPAPNYLSETDADRLPLLQLLLDGMSNPSYVADPLWTVVAMNTAASKTFSMRVGENCLQRFFSDDDVARSYLHHEKLAVSMVAQFRAQSGQFLDDPRFDALAKQLCEVSETFREAWNRQVVGDSYQVGVIFEHPLMGKLSFDPVILGLPQAPTLRLITYLPQSGTRTEGALRTLSRTLSHQQGVDEVHPSAAKPSPASSQRQAAETARRAAPEIVASQRANEYAGVATQA